MVPPAVRGFPILEAAASLGLEVNGTRARCFNTAAHKGADAHPSLVFLTDVNRFKCYACGIKGDVIDLVRAVRQSGFRDAVRWLEDLAGPEFRADPPPAAVQRSSSTPDAQACEVYLAMYEASYEIDAEMVAGRYLIGRGLDLQLANQHGAVQYDQAQELWDELLGKFGQDRLRAAGLVSRSGQFLFARHRLLLFYFDVEDPPLYVQARDIAGEAGVKELSLAGLHSPVPYNVKLLRQRPAEVCICEGCIDTLSAIQLGYPAVGVPGVTGFRREWFELFRGVRHVHILFDNDEAGQRQAAELRAQFRMRGVRTDVYRPRELKDINDLLTGGQKMPPAVTPATPYPVPFPAVPG
jgi:DNA primase